MTTSDIIQLDCRDEKQREIIQKVLRQIKPLSRYSDEVPFEAIEKAIVIMSKKYNVRIRDFVPDVWSNETETVWKAVIVNEDDLSIVAVIYGISLYELFAKCAIQMYSMVRKE